MVAIINLGGPADGVCKYSVGINRDVIAEFEHDRRDGLEVCLRKAADAVRDAGVEDDYEKLFRFLGMKV